MSEAALTNELESCSTHPVQDVDFGAGGTPQLVGYSVTELYSGEVELIRSIQPIATGSKAALTRLTVS